MKYPLLGILPSSRGEEGKSILRKHFSQTLSTKISFNAIELDKPFIFGWLFEEFESKLDLWKQ